MNNANSRMRGLLATLALIGFVVGVPVVLVAIHAIPDPSAFSWSRLTAQDDGIVALQVIGAVCWIAWAVFTCQLAASIMSQVRGRRAPRLPGLAVPQLAADRLVAAAALLFIAVPAVSAVLPQPRAHAAVATPLTDATIIVDVAQAPTMPATNVDVVKGPATERYTVKRGDSLWKIAEERLGDGTRYVELVDLNNAVLGGRPDFLLPGTVLKVPIADDSSDGSYVVRPGDTLSEIAEKQLGDADAYTAIFEASRDTDQANGAHLSDPDLILPGWKLTLPGQAEPSKPKHVGPPQTKPETVPPESQPSPRPETVDDTAGPADVDAGPSEHVLPAWVLPGLAGSSAVFGACLWVALRQKRRTQLRFRRPGTILATPPASLRSAEKTARITASALAPQVEALDSALRHLDPAPRLLSATLGHIEIKLTLAEPADLPSPWTGASHEWAIAIDDVPPRPEDSFPPYPLLVSVGQSDDTAFVFLNLEELRTVSVTGEDDGKSSFARHLAAELAVNPWSVVTTVDVLGVGADLAAFNLGRVRTHPAGDAEFIAQLARIVPSELSNPDPDDFHAVIVATASRPDGALDELRAAIKAASGRCAAVLIDLTTPPTPGDVPIAVTHGGRLRVEGLGIDVTAAKLSEEEARACALLLDLTLETSVVPVPRGDDDAVSDLGGALAEELIDERLVEPAGERSLLPLDAHMYAEIAATTVEDVDELAPIAVPEARQIVEKNDPALDDDLARWESPTVSADKLILLGPVSARTVGDTKTTAHRRPFYIELLAYLTLHPAGATRTELADAFGLRVERVRVDMSALRRWLGTDPRTGELYLPNADTSGSGDEPARYRLHGVLCDLDLFRRLRARGQSRGAEGIADLISALRLVSGEPFTDLRQEHWNWLLDGERWDHIMTSAIVDVGHLVTTHALANADAKLAGWAASVAYAAAPYDEVAQLDMIAAGAAAGDHERAEADLRAKVLDRRDDDLPPIAVPHRTEQIVRGKRWHDPANRRTG